MTRFEASWKARVIEVAIAILISATLMPVLVRQPASTFPAGGAKLIAVASGSNEAASLIGRDPVHCAYFLLFAPTGELLNVLENPYKGGSKGAEQGIADFLARHKVDMVVAEDFTPALIRVLEAAGIGPVAFEGLAREAVERIGPGV